MKHLTWVPLVQLVPRSAGLEVGEHITLDVRIDEVAELASIELEVVFDPLMLEVQDMEPAIAGIQAERGEFPAADLGLMTQNEADNVSGRVRLALVSKHSEGFSGSGVFARITFRALVAGTTRVTLPSVILADARVHLVRAVARGATLTLFPGSVPTAGPSATSEALLTATPPAPGCASLGANGGFEADGGWDLGGSPLPRLVTSPVSGGAHSLLLGILPGEAQVAGPSAAWQRLHVPSSAGLLSVAARMLQGTDGAQGNDWQLVFVTDRDPALGGDLPRKAVVLSERAINSGWRHRSVTFPVTEHRDADLWVYAAVQNDGRFARGWMFLDDVEATACP